MANVHITGIQQIGIGVTNADEAARRYKNLFGMGALVFDDTAEASLMTRYTGGDAHRRRALLTLNMQGGGGFEIWQFLDRTPAQPTTRAAFGDLGIFAAILKCDDVAAAHRHLSGKAGTPLSPVQTSAHGHPQCWATDAWGNNFLLTEYNERFNGLQAPVGGVLGAVIGVSNMDAALRLYRDVLGISTVVSDVTGESADTPDGPPTRCRRVLLRKTPDGRGAFGKLLGSVQLELVQVLDSTPAKLYEGRFWGDSGFIHLCFDVLDMDGLKSAAAAAGFNFTVDSQSSFAMEKAAGRFCYVEDGDGTLIELVETHKVPVLKKWGIYLNLKKRGLENPLPDWMVKLLGMSKVK